MSNTIPDDHTEDPITRVVRMAQTGDVSQITTPMLEEALAYSKEQDRLRALQDQETPPN